MNSPSSVFLIGILWLAGLGVETASGARLVKASVSYDGVVILEGSTSDDGRVDADGVWAYLKTLKFKPTAAFADRKIDPATGKTTLTGAGEGVALADSKITVSIAFGGSAKFRELTLIRVPKDSQGKEWRLDPVQVDDRFASRLISRREAARLRNPGKDKP